MKVWITQFALSSGILEVDSPKQHTTKMLSWETNGFTTYCHKPHWHESEKEAIEHAKGMRQRKIGGLQKQIAKLESMTFEPKSKKGEL